VTVQLTQDTLLEALRCLRKAHPELPAIDWRIGQYAHELQGEVGPANTIAAFEAYAAVLGGGITEGAQYTYEPAGVPTLMQVYRLRSVWADVPVALTGSVPVAQMAVSA
jgi:hypothetical protein